MGRSMERSDQPLCSFCSLWSASPTGLGRSRPRACLSDDPHLPKIAFASFYPEENLTSVRMQRRAPCVCAPGIWIVYKAHSLKTASPTPNEKISEAKCMAEDSTALVRSAGPRWVPQQAVARSEEWVVRVRCVSWRFCALSME